MNNGNGFWLVVDEDTETTEGKKRAQHLQQKTRFALHLKITRAIKQTTCVYLEYRVFSVSSVYRLYRAGMCNFSIFLKC